MWDNTMKKKPPNLQNPTLFVLRFWKITNRNTQYYIITNYWACAAAPSSCTPSYGLHPRPQLGPTSPWRSKSILNARLYRHFLMTAKNMKKVRSRRRISCSYARLLTKWLELYGLKRVLRQICICLKHNQIW